jgi:APA family basic amino acid/polyamine antiporter
LAVYSGVGVAVLAVLGPARLAASAAPLVEAVRVAEVGWLIPIVGVGAALAALGSLLALILGVSRTTLAMARDRNLPHPLAAVHRRFKVPHRAEVVVGVVVAVPWRQRRYPRRNWVLVLRGVLVHYAIANASAFILNVDEGRPPRAHTRG